MTSMPHDQTPLDAVDALFELRAQIAALREREAELCDEIRTYATENDARNVPGVNRVAVIETRRPTRIDPAKLPPAIVNDPYFFESEEETLVLLWPHSSVQAAPHSAPLAPLVAAEVETTAPEGEVEAEAEVTLPTSVEPSVDIPAEEITLEVETPDAAMDTPAFDAPAAEAPAFSALEDDAVAAEPEEIDALPDPDAELASSPVAALDTDAGMPTEEMSFAASMDEAIPPALDTAFEAELSAPESAADMTTDLPDMAEMAATPDMPTVDAPTPDAPDLASPSMEMETPPETEDMSIAPPALDELDADPVFSEAPASLDMPKMEAEEPAAIPELDAGVTPEIEMGEMPEPESDVEAIAADDSTPPADPPQMRTIGVPPQEPDVLAEMLDIAPEPPADPEIAAELPEEDAMAPAAQGTPVTLPEFEIPVEETELTAEIAPGLSAELTPEFAAAPEENPEAGIDATPMSAPEPEAAEFSAEDPFGLQQQPLRAASPEMPPVNGDNAVEMDTPRDLRPTGHADLQPLAGLHDEEVARALAEADAPLEPATLPDALDLTQSLEAEADRNFAAEPRNGEATETNATPFASRRITASGDI